MSRVDTLTAYRCTFSYMQRNNPKIEELREKIKSGGIPEFSLTDFVTLYKEKSSKLLIGANSDRAIQLSNSRVSSRALRDVNSWHLSPDAGKQGKPVKVVKQSTGKEYAFGSDAAALYSYNVFFYESESGIIAIFHRQSGSGCKSVFLETANNILKNEGLKLDMELIVPVFDEVKDVIPTKITLQYVETKISSDPADNIRKKRKKRIIRELGLNLEVLDNARISSILYNMQLGKITKAQAFASIKAEVKGAGDFNDAEINFKFGKSTRRLPWNELEQIVGARDITADLHEAYLRTKDFVDALTNLADKYYYDIVESGAIADG